MPNNGCQHKRQQDVCIGHENSVDSLVYKMSVCLDCGKYIDKLGNLIMFQNMVSEKIGYEWRWKEDYMPQEELKTMKPDHIRITWRVINPLKEA